jgi:hypothetical protein
MCERNIYSESTSEFCGKHFKTTETEYWERDGIIAEVTGRITNNVSGPNTESR